MDNSVVIAGGGGMRGMNGDGKNTKKRKKEKPTRISSHLRLDLSIIKNDNFSIALDFNSWETFKS